MAAIASDSETKISLDSILEWVIPYADELIARGDVYGVEQARNRHFVKAFAKYSREDERVRNAVERIDGWLTSVKARESHLTD